MDAKSLIYQFDDVSVDLEKFEVVKADVRTHLEPKAFEALVFLIEHRGRLVEKKELLDAVWKDAFVTENAMTRVIAQLRKVLGDDSKEAKYIETVPTRGYRFIPTVSESAERDSIHVQGEQAEQHVTAGSPASATEVTPDNLAQVLNRLIGPIVGRRVRTLLLLTMLTIAGASITYLVRQGKPTGNSDSAIDSVAVLPFANASDDLNSQYLSDGITESLIYNLSQLPDLRVMSLNSVSRYKGQDPQSAARQLGVRAVVLGMVSQRGDNLTISAELVDVRDNHLLWGESYHFCPGNCPGAVRKIAGILGTQEDISREISERLRSKLTSEETGRVNKYHTDDSEAHQLYLMGRFHVDKRTVADAERARDYFQQAVAKDANYALAYAGMSDAYIALYLLDGLPAQDAMPKAKEAALTGLKIDDRLSELHAALGDVKKLYDWDWAGAEREFRRALELDPRSVRAHHLYAHFLKDMGRFDESISEINAALHEEPTSVVLNRVLAQILYDARRYDEAIVQCNKTLEMDPHFGTVYGWLGLAYEQKGLRDLAVKTFLKGRAVEGSAQDVSAYEAAYKKAGWRGYWELELERLQTAKKRYGWINENAIADVYVRLGRTDLAIESLERALRERSIQIDLKIEPRLDGIRSDPRFERLLSLMKFPP